jgi:hypothetical protein
VPSTNAHDEVEDQRELVRRECRAEHCDCLSRFSISTRALDKYDLTEDEKRELVRIYVPYQGSGRYGFDATILPAIARGFLAGKKRRQPD